MTPMKSFIRKPKPFSAVQLTKENAIELNRMVGGNLQTGTASNPGVHIYFHCCSGRVCVELGDWIVRRGAQFEKMTNEEMTRDCEELSA
jgi:hypothetical protein